MKVKMNNSRLLKYKKEPRPGLKSLTPSQKEMADQILDLLPVTNLVLPRIHSGLGCSTILSALREELGARLIVAEDVLRASFQLPPSSFYKAVFELFEDAIATNDVVLVDDLPISDRFRSESFPPGILEMMMSTLCGMLQDNNKKMIWAPHANPELSSWGQTVELRSFCEADYRFLLRKFLGAAASQMDIHQIFKFAPNLDGHDLRKACEHMKVLSARTTTGQLIEYLREEGLQSNVELDEVENLGPTDIQGLDGALEQLEKRVIFPLTQNHLSDEFKFQPPRGVVIFGPPGTGKTSIGRYLAHKLKAKFLLIDGRSLSDPDSLQRKIRCVFAQAEQNAPAVIFMDDFDSIWNKENPLYHMMLSELDGIENQKKSTICLIMTVMDIAKLPAALVRSGRLELWLQTSLPDEKARLAMLKNRIAALPHPLSSADPDALVQETAGFNGADIRALVEIAKVSFGFDAAQGSSPLLPQEYFEAALQAVQEHKKGKLAMGFSNGTEQ